MMAYFAGRAARGDVGHMEPPKQGRYEVRDYQGGGLKVIVWCEPGRPELVMTTIAAARLPALAEALNEHLAGGPA
jgi:hypothetical protein